MFLISIAIQTTFRQGFENFTHPRQVVEDNKANKERSRRREGHYN